MLTHPDPDVRIPALSRGTVDHVEISSRRPRAAGKTCRMPDALHELEQTLLSRRETRPEGSYSAELFSDHERLMRKIMEESFEVCLELGRGSVDPEAVASEAADLVYHLLAGLVSVDVRLDDVLWVLEQRR